MPKIFSMREPYLLDSFPQNVSVNDLAKEFYRSPAQLNRDFYAATGYSVHEYQRCRRLSQALCFIKSSSLSLADISYQCGYSSQQALCREIRNQLGMTATEYRESDAYYFLSDCDSDIPYITEVSKVNIPQTICLRFYHPVLPGLESLAVQTFLASNPDYSGRIFGRNGMQYRNRFCYELYVEESEGLHTDGFSGGVLRPSYSAVCAQIRVRNVEEEIGAAWDWLYSVWLANSMFVYAGADDLTFENTYFEEYCHRNTRVPKLRLYLPLRHQNSLMKVTLEHKTFSFLVSDSTGPSAETEASRTVLQFLAHFRPGVLQNAVQFYHQERDNRCTCGVNTEGTIPHDDSLRTICYENTPFAILHCNGIHAYSKASEQLLSWLRENGFQPSDSPFAVYDTTENEDNPDMMVYCPLKK